MSTTRRSFRAILPLLLLLTATTLPLIRAQDDLFGTLSAWLPQITTPSLNPATLDYSLIYSNMTRYIPSWLRISNAYLPRSYTNSLYSSTKLQAVGGLLITDPDIYQELDNEFLCAPLPPTLTVSAAFLNRSAEFSRSRHYVPSSDPQSRWSPLNTTATVAGSVLMVSRGNCSFQLKSFYAQQAGAAGLIITGTQSGQWKAWPPLDEKRIVMQGNDTFPQYLRDHGLIGTDENFNFAIPSVYIIREDFQDLWTFYARNLFAQLEFYNNINQFAWTSQNISSSPSSSSSTGGGANDTSSTAIDSSTSTTTTSTSSDPSASSSGSASSSSSTSVSAVRRLLESEGGSQQHREMIFAVDGPTANDLAVLKNYTQLVSLRLIINDQTTMTVEPQEYESFRVAAYFLLVLPSLWCFVAILYVGRRCGMRYRERQRRDIRKTLLPIVKYHILTPAELAQRPLNVKSSSSSPSPPPPKVSGPVRPTLAEYPLEPSRSSAEQPFLTHESKEQHESAIEMNTILPAAQRRSSGIGTEQLHGAGSRRASGAGLSSAASLVLDVEDDHAVAAPSSSTSPTADSGPIAVGIDKRNHHLPIIGSSCAICLCEFEEGETLTHLPCLHAYHSTCLAPWLEKSDECATCRRSMSTMFDEAANKRAHWCSRWFCPIGSEQQTEFERQLAERRRSAAGRAGQRAEVHQNREQQRDRLISASRAVREERRAADLLSSQPATTSSSSSASSNSTPAVSSSPDLYQAITVRKSVLEFIGALEPEVSSLPREDALEEAIRELKLMAREYEERHASGRLTPHSASLLLKQILAELAIITHFAHEHEELVEAGVTCESVLLFAQESLQRA